MHPMMSCEVTTVRLPGLLALPSGRGRPSPMTPLPPPAVANKMKPAATSARCACASSRRGDAEEFSWNGGDGRLVDEGMPVLRRRIHKMEAAERGCSEPPQEWAEWEEEWSYDSDVCQLPGAIQAFAFFINSRPGVAVGLVAVLLLAVPASAFVLVSLLLDVSRAIISNRHH